MAEFKRTGYSDNNSFDNNNELAYYKSKCIELEDKLKLLNSSYYKPNEEYKPSNIVQRNKYKEPMNYNEISV